MEVFLKLDDVERIALIKSVLETNFKEPYTVESMAGIVGMNTTKFKSGFKQVFQTTPFLFLTRIRIEKAKSLLEQTDLPIQIIGSEVGYAFSGNFIKRFKQVTGISPLKWRKNSRKKLSYTDLLTTNLLSQLQN